MRPKASKNTDLLKKYPFVNLIIESPMEPFDGLEGNKIDNLTIKVEKADGDLMYRRADNVGVGDSSCIFQIKGNRQDQVMRRGEYAFAVNRQGKIINRLNFPRNDKERRQFLGETYAYAVLWGSKMLNASGTSYLYTNSLSKHTEYVVWVTVEAWHTDTKKDDGPSSRFGKFRDRSVSVTIYQEPEGGFDKLREEASLYTNLRIDSNILMRGMVDKNYDIITIGGMLYEMCITFQDEVYFKGMKEILDTAQCRGASGEFGSVKVLAVEMCGYDRVMLEDAVSYVTFQLRPGSKHMYVLGQQGTLPQIRNLVRTVVKMWSEKPELREAFKPDKDVSVI